MPLPLLKWTGGKRSELSVLRPLFPTSFKRVIEPFAGGAAVSFDRGETIEGCVLNDVSTQLIAFYQCVQDDTTRVVFLNLLDIVDQTRKNIRKATKALSDAKIQSYFKDPEKAVAFALSTWNNENGKLPKPLRDAGAKDIEKSVRDKCQTRIPNLEQKRQKAFDVSERRDHLETAMQAGLYTTLRRLYNSEPLLDKTLTHNQQWGNVAWFVVRGLCYSGMFRYGKNGKFNVPYGGIGYNSRDFATNKKQLSDTNVVNFLKKTNFHCLDFDALFDLYTNFNGQDDFIFVDPPYDSAFSQYNKDEDFTQDDQKRLAKRLQSLKTPFMLVIKNTPFILNLYDKKGMHHAVFGKNYQVNFRNRHDRAVTHLIVTNYPLDKKTLESVGGQKIKAKGYFT